MSEEHSREFESFDEPASNLPLLDKLDRVIASLPPGDPGRRDLLDLRPHLSDQSQMIGEARQMIEKLEEVIKKVTSPANRIGTFLGATSKDTAHIVVGGADYYCNVDPRIPLAKLKKGTRVLVNEAFVIVGDLGFETAGPVTKITEVIGKDRLRVGSEHGTQSLVLQRSADLASSTLKSGDEVRVDSNYRMALEMLSSTKSHEHYLDVVPELPWEKVGGQEEALQAIKDAIELPLLHVDLFKKFQHATPKGFLLYGPPGCGKTLIGKATAYNLTKQLGEKTGAQMKEYFMHVKGPEILNMWVGESERMVRETFRKAKTAAPCIIFFDEVDAITPVRGGMEDSQVTERVISQILTEMDGLEELHNVTVIAATNRMDLVDPALLRPGRFDRHIYIAPPDLATRKAILKIHARRKPLGKDVDLDDIARRTDRYTGAELAAVCNEAAMLAIRETATKYPDLDEATLKKVTIEKRHFEAALKKVQPQTGDPSLYSRLPSRFPSSPEVS